MCKMKTPSEIFFRIIPAHFRSLLGVCLSVVEMRGSEWFRNEVLDMCLSRKGGGIDYPDVEGMDWGRKHIALPARYTYLFRNADVSLEMGRCAAGCKWISESFGHSVNVPCEVFPLRVFGCFFRLIGRNKKLPDNGGLGYVYCRGDGYFHFVAESLVSLLYSLRFKEMASVVVVKSHYERFPYFKQYIELLKKNGKIRDVIEVDTDFIQAPNYVMTAYEFDAGVVCRQSVDLLRDALLPKDYVVVARRIFLTRRGRRCFDNQDALEKIAKQNGFEVIDTDGMSVEKQINLFREANVVVSNHGAGLTNMIYMKPGGRIVELFSSKWRNDCYFRLSAVMEHKYSCLSAGKTKGWGKINECSFDSLLKSVV